MAEDKVESIREWKSPKSVRNVQVSISFANFYRRFIKNFRGICKTITDTLKEGGLKFNWSTECEIAFRKLKRMFTTALIPRHYDSTLPTQLETDASDFAIG